MIFLLLFALTIFNSPAIANGILVEEYDPIMRESLSRQGVPAPPFESAPERQAQQEDKQQQQQMVEVSQEELQKLRKQIQALQRQVDKLKTRQQAQEQRSQETKEGQKTEQKKQDEKVTRVSIQQGLRNAEKVGEFGRYGIMAGTTTAKAWKLGDTADEREVPALQVCSTLADVNRMSAQDFVFMGLEPAVAKEVIQARELLGKFSSSKQITAVEGVEPETFETLRQSVIAVDLEERLAE